MSKEKEKICRYSLVLGIKVTSPVENLKMGLKCLLFTF